MCKHETYFKRRNITRGTHIFTVETIYLKKKNDKKVGASSSFAPFGEPSRSAVRCRVIIFSPRGRGLHLEKISLRVV